MTVPTSTPIGELLEWDSQFFGLRIARFNRRSFGSADADAALRFCAEHAVDCLYILIDSADDESVRVVQEAGGRLVDIRVTLEVALPAALPGVSASGSVRAATIGDVRDLRRIARDSHHDTRFYADPGFDRERCHLLYETWIENSCHADSDAVFVAEEHDGAPSGYVACRRESSDSGRIGLIGVGPAKRSRGLGTALVQEALRWFSSQGLQSARVSTQARNSSALRLYERHGFMTADVHTWFHLWPARHP